MMNVAFERVYKSVPLIHRRIINRRQSLLDETDFSIVSDNCWGGFMYQYFGLPYSSPFIGLFVFSPDYLSLLQNFETALVTPLIFIERHKSKYADAINSSYPIGVLSGEIELHFLHYSSERDARDCWSRRLGRINFDNLIFKFCDRDFATPNLIGRFDGLSFEKKICLSAKNYDYPSVLKLKGEFGDEIQDEWKSFMRTVAPIDLLNRLGDGEVRA